MKTKSGALLKNEDTIHRTINFSPSQYAKIMAAAKRNQQHFSEFIRAVAMDAAERLENA